ncbi:SDR family NAD(P)-dependent oxidoreductase [Rhizosphaericola mali]|uniref:SDR family NAD(P)-dependent oxidoreductase n=1 Tax=Rhizosphaericola mali TaxID=2545455 RepID=A0A5P2G5Q8_9BACT|nr:SDR family oxidoreductase [Rhizosphaericola mali]QES90567.1 SDR family NAD(P)-dependent oxidoreductase [Rhizosphaericola mali]
MTDNLSPENSRRKFVKNAASLASLAAIAGLASNPLSADAHTNSPKDKKTKIAVVTGAARGMGRSICLALAKEGMTIHGIDILDKVSNVVEYKPSTPADILETQKLVEAAGQKFTYSKADIRDLAALNKVAAELKAKYGHVDVLVADAGVQAFSSIVDSTPEHWNTIIGTNVIGTANTMIAFLPLIIPQKMGKVVILASTQGMRGMWNGAAYAASKWGLVGLAKSVAIEMGPHHINVNVVVPGLVNTEMTHNLKRWQVAMGPGYENAQVTEAQVSEVLSKKDALGLPWVEADDIAPAVVFLTSDAANKITGAVYDVAAGTSTVYTS